MTLDFDWLRGHAQRLEDGGLTYKQAREMHNQVGVSAGWPILAVRLLDDGFTWPEVCYRLGLNRTPAGQGSLRLADLDEQDRAALLAQAREEGRAGARPALTPGRGSGRKNRDFRPQLRRRGTGSSSASPKTHRL